MYDCFPCRSCKYRQWDACFISWKYLWGKPKIINTVCEFQSDSAVGSCPPPHPTPQAPVSTVSYRKSQKNRPQGRLLSALQISHLGGGNNNTYLVTHFMKMNKVKCTTYLTRCLASENVLCLHLWQSFLRPSSWLFINPAVWFVLWS